MLRTFKDLIVWQKSYALCVRVYTLTKQFPAEEKFGMVSQLRRSSVSIPSNISEGYNKDTTKDYLRFLSIALGSLAEMETQMMLCKDLKMCQAPESEDVLETIAEVDRMLRALIRSLKQKSNLSSRRTTTM